MNNKWTKMLLYRGTEFCKCYAFTVIGLILGWLLHCGRMVAMIYFWQGFSADPFGTILLLFALGIGADVGFFFLLKSLLTQLSFLLGTYRVEENKLIFHFPLWGEMSCSYEEIAAADFCTVCCFHGGAEQKVFRILLQGYTEEDKSTHIFQNTGIAWRKKAFFFAEPAPVQEFIHRNEAQTTVL